MVLKDNDDVKQSVIDLSTSVTKDIEKLNREPRTIFEYIECEVKNLLTLDNNPNADVIESRAKDFYIKSEGYTQRADINKDIYFLDKNNKKVSKDIIIGYARSIKDMILDRHHFIVQGEL